MPHKDRDKRATKMFGPQDLNLIYRARPPVKKVDGKDGQPKRPSMELGPPKPVPQGLRPPRELNLEPQALPTMAGGRPIVRVQTQRELEERFPSTRPPADASATPPAESTFVKNVKARTAASFEDLDAINEEITYTEALRDEGVITTEEAQQAVLHLHSLKRTQAEERHVPPAKEPTLTAGPVTTTSTLSQIEAGLPPEELTKARIAAGTATVAGQVALGFDPAQEATLFNDFIKTQGAVPDFNQWLPYATEHGIDFATMPSAGIEAFINQTMTMVQQDSTRREQQALQQQREKEDLANAAEARRDAAMVKGDFDVVNREHQTMLRLGVDANTATREANRSVFMRDVVYTDPFKLYTLGRMGVLDEIGGFLGMDLSGWVDIGQIVRGRPAPKNLGELNQLSTFERTIFIIDQAIARKMTPEEWLLEALGSTPPAMRKPIEFVG